MTQGELAKLIDDEVAKRPEAVGDILSALGCAVARTIEHVETNWQDKKLASKWGLVYRAIDRACAIFHKNLFRGEVS